MQLEKQVSSPELSKRLKELGVKQESHFRWYHASLIPWNVVTSHGFSNEEARERSPSAFTVAELGEMLPTYIEKDGEQLFLLSDVSPGNWGVMYAESDYNKFKVEITADTEADARARMLQYLLENGIVSAYEINEKVGSN